MSTTAGLTLPQRSVGFRPELGLLFLNSHQLTHLPDDVTSQYLLTRRGGTASLSSTGWAGITAWSLMWPADCGRFFRVNLGMIFQDFPGWSKTTSVEVVETKVDAEK